MMASIERHDVGAQWRWRWRHLGKIRVQISRLFSLFILILSSSPLVPYFLSTTAFDGTVHPDARSQLPAPLPNIERGWAERNGNKSIIDPNISEKTEKIILQTSSKDVNTVNNRVFIKGREVDDEALQNVASSRVHEESERESKNQASAVLSTSSSSLSPAVPQQELLAAAAASKEKAPVHAAASGVNMLSSTSSSDAGAAEESTLRGGAAPPPAALPGDAIVLNERSNTPSDSSNSNTEGSSTNGSSREGSGTAGGIGASVSETTKEETVSPSSGSSGGTLKSDTAGGNGERTSAAMRDRDFGWSSAAGNTLLQNRMCRALKADRQLALEFILFALSLIDASSFIPARQATSSVEKEGPIQRGQQQTQEKHSYQGRQLQAGALQKKRRWHSADETRLEQFQRGLQNDQQRRQQDGWKGTLAMKTLVDISALGADMAKGSPSSSRSNPFQRKEASESLQNDDGLVPWKVVARFIEKLQGRALVTDDLLPQYAWQNRAPCRLIPLAAAQWLSESSAQVSVFQGTHCFVDLGVKVTADQSYLQRIVWSVKEVLRHRTKEERAPRSDDVGSPKKGPLMVPYGKVINELLDKASKRAGNINRGHTSNSSSNGNTGGAPWDTKRMKALSQSVPKLKPAETTLEILLSVAASLWSSYLVITDLESGRTVEAVVEETAGHRINTVRRRYGNALHVLSETSKELVSDGHLCGHIFVLLEGFVSPSVVESMPWYNVAYFEGELLRYMQEELQLSLKPLEEAYSIAATYKAERSTERAAAVVSGPAAASSERVAPGEEESSQRPQEKERIYSDENAVNGDPSGGRFSAPLKREIEKPSAVGHTGHVIDLPVTYEDTGLTSRPPQQEIDEKEKGWSLLPEGQELYAAGDPSSRDNKDSTLSTDNSSGYSWRKGLASDRANETAVGEDTQRREESGLFSEPEGRPPFKDLALPEVRLTGYHVNTVHGTFNAGLVGESNTFEVNEKLRKAFTEDGVLLEILLCQKHDRFRPSLAEEEPRVTEWAAEALDSDYSSSLTEDNSSSVEGDRSRSETVAAGQKGSSSNSSSSLNIGGGRRLDSVAAAPWNDGFSNMRTRPKRGIFSPVLKDPPGAGVSAEQLRHMRAAADAASGVSAAVAEAAAAAAAAARRDAAAAAAVIDPDGDEDDEMLPPTTASRTIAADAAAPPTNQVPMGGTHLRGDRASLRQSHWPPLEESGTSANAAATSAQTLGETATADAIAKAAALAGLHPEYDEDKQDPRFPLLLTMQAFSRHLGEGKPMWIFNRCRVVHSTIEDRHGSSSIFHHLMLTPDSDTDIHFFVNMPRQKYSKQAAEELRQSFLLLGRTAHSSESSSEAGRVLQVHVRDSRLRILGTAQRSEDGKLLKLQSFGLSLDDNQRHNVNQFIHKDKILLHFHLTGLASLRPYLPPGQEWRSMRADRLFARIVSSCRSFLEIPYAIKVQVRAIQRRSKSLNDAERGGVPTWLLATAVICTAFPLLLFMCCLQFNGHMPTPWWLSCVFSSRPPWGEDLPRRPAEEESRNLTRVTTRSVSATSERMRRYAIAARERVNALYQQQQYEQQLYEQQLYEQEQHRQQHHQLQEEYRRRHSQQLEEEEQQRQELQQQEQCTRRERTECNPMQHGVLVAQPLNRHFRNDDLVEACSRTQGQRRSPGSGTPSPEIRSSCEPRRFSVATNDNSALVRGRDRRDPVVYKRSMTCADVDIHKERQRKLSGARRGSLSDSFVSGRGVALPIGTGTNGVFPGGRTRRNTRVARRRAKEMKRKLSSGRTFATRRTLGVKSCNGNVKTTGTNLKLASPADDGHTGPPCLPQGRHRELSMPRNSENKELQGEDDNVFCTTQTASSSLSSKRTDTTLKQLCSLTGDSSGRKVRNDKVGAKVRSVPNEGTSRPCDTGENATCLAERASCSTQQEVFEGARTLSDTEKEAHSIKDIPTTIHGVTSPKEEFGRKSAAGVQQCWNSLQSMEENCATDLNASRRGPSSDAGRASSEHLLKKVAAYPACGVTLACAVLNTKTPHSTFAPRSRVSVPGNAGKRKESPVEADHVHKEEANSFESAFTKRAGYAKSFCTSSSGETNVRWRRSNTPLTQTSTIDASWSSTQMNYDETKTQKKTDLHALQESSCSLQDYSEFSE